MKNKYQLPPFTFDDDPFKTEKIHDWLESTLGEFEYEILIKTLNNESFENDVEQELSNHFVTSITQQGYDFCKINIKTVEEIDLHQFTYALVENSCYFNHLKCYPLYYVSKTTNDNLIVTTYFRDVESLYQIHESIDSIDELLFYYCKLVDETEIRGIKKKLKRENYSIQFYSAT